MQVRLKVQRAHAAIVASIPYWEAREAEAYQAHQGYLDRRAKKLMLKRSFCGGYKYNEAEARALAKTGIYGQWETHEEFSHTYINHKVRADTLARMRLLEAQTANKSGFMIWFEEKDYIKFSPNLNYQ